MTLAHFRADSGLRSRVYPFAVLVGLVLLLSLGVGRLHGQTTQGSILGNVTDQAGAVVPGVEIEVKSQETNFARKTVTNTQGFFLVDRLEPGTYDLMAAAPGFQKIARLGTQLVTNAQVRIDLTLQVAQTNEQVTVNGTTPVIETETARIGTVFDRNMQTYNATAGRTFFDMLLASPAAFWSGNGYAVQVRAVRTRDIPSMACRSAISATEVYRPLTSWITRTARNSASAV